MRKASICIILFFVIAGSLFAAGGGETADGAEEQKTVSLFISGKSVWGESMEAVVAKFNESYPNITIDYEVVGGGTDHRPVLASRAQTNSLPDIFMIDGPSDFALYGEYLDDLSDMDVVDHFLPIAEESAYVDGQLMGLPVSIEGYGYIYNRDLFAQAGIDEVPSTFSELSDAVDKLQAAGITPFVSGYGTWWVIGMHQLNVPFAIQNDPMAFMEGLNDGSSRMVGNQYFQDLERLINLVVENTDGDPLAQDHNMQVSLFAAGQGAMIQQGNWKEAAILDANPDMDMGLVPLALTDDAGRSGGIPVGIPWYFVVTEDSEVNAEARIFLNWLLNEPAGQNELATTLNSIPAYDHFDAEFAGGISNDILAYSLEGKTIPWVFGRFPQGYTQSAAEFFQEFVAGRVSYEDTLIRLENEWQSLAD
jgi:raffinose/stachyose/melibiose transport system substrate-binding protein